MRTILLLASLLCLAASCPGQTIDTVAGTGKAGFGGDGGPANLAALDEPFGVDLDGEGRLLIADAAGRRIRRVDLVTGIISTVAGTGKAGKSTAGTLAIDSPINTPYAVTWASGGDLFVVEQHLPVVLKIDGKTGRMSPFAGSGQKGSSGDGGPGPMAKLVEPNDACLDGKGGLLIADVGDGRVRRVDLATGIITTFAGVGRVSGKPDRSKIGDGGPATKAVILGARSVCVDGSGNTYLCEREGNAIRKVDASGVITTVAGTGVPGDSGDGGLATLATFRGPKGVRVDRSGSLFVVDTENHAIRKIDARSGMISTIAGGHKGGDGDGGVASKAGLSRPHGCVVAADGTLYIADSENHRVRRVRP